MVDVADLGHQSSFTPQQNDVYMKVQFLFKTDHLGRRKINPFPDISKIVKLLTSITLTKLKKYNSSVVEDLQSSSLENNL